MKKYSGFSLIELMVALAVLSVLLSVGLPRMSVYFKGTRMITNTNDLIAGLHIARSEAIKRNQRVSICRSSNAGDEVPVCSTDTTDWSKGWFVFVEGQDEGNVIGTYTGDDGAVLKINKGAEGQSVTIKTSSTDIDEFVSFNSRGVAKGQSGVFRVCDDRGLKNVPGAEGVVVARGIVLGASGRVRVTKDETRIGGVNACP